MLSVFQTNSHPSPKTLDILLVEDNVAEVELIKELIAEGQETEISLTTVDRLSKALELIREQRFDAILLDLSLPDSQGLNTVSQLHEYGLNIPIVVLTSQDDETMALRTIQTGAQDYLVKGKVESVDLMRTLHYAIERRQINNSPENYSQGLHNILTSLEDMVWSVNAESWELDYQNLAAERIYGRPIRDFWENRKLWLEMIYPEDQERVITTLQNLQNLDGTQIEYRIQRPNGQVRWLQVRARLICSENGIPLRIDGTSTDITDRKTSEVALTQRERYLSTLVKVQRQLLGEDTQEDRYSKILKLLGETSGACRVYYFEHHTDVTGVLRMNRRWEWCAEGVTPQQDNPIWRNFALEEHFPGWGDILGLGGAIAGLMSDFPPSVQHILAPQKVQAILLLPILVKGELVGSIGFDNCQEARSWNNLEIDLLRATTSALALYQEHTLVENSLRDSEANYRSVINNLNEVIFKRDNQGCWTFLNSAWTKITGFSIEETLGKPYLDFVHPEDRQYCSNYYHSLAKGVNEGDRHEIRYLTQDGGYRWLEVQKQLVIDENGKIIGTSGTLTDITERKLIEQVEKEERQHLRTIIENAPVAMAMFDKKMRYLAYSNQWLKDLGLDDNNLIGRCHYDVFPNIPVERKQVYSRALQGEVLSSSEDMFEFPNGRKNHLRWAVQPWYGSDGDIEGIVIVNQIINELVEAREAALEASRMKSQFLANMSHEIRTPMNGVIGMTDLLLKTPVNHQQQDFLQTLKASGQNLLTLINDILDFSKLEAGEMRLDSEEFDLNYCIEEVIHLLGMQAQTQEIELLSLIDADVPKILKGDASRLRQILMNLAGNALKFTDEGEVVIRVSLADQSPDHSSHLPLYFEVRDTGVGISQENQEKLFRSFSQVDASSTRKYGGTGLGLAICQQLVHLMGGKIGVESIPGEGSIFWFTATFEASTADLHSNSDFLNESIPAISTLSGLKMLVGSDSATTCEVLTSYASAWGIECETTSSYGDAIALLEKAVELGQPYNLALIDLQSASMDGENLGQYLSNNPVFGQTHWIVMVSLQQHEQVKHLLQEGASGYLLKPLTPSRLFECLINVVSSSYCDISQSPVTQTPTLTPQDEEKRKQVKILVVEDTPINQRVILNQLNILGYTGDCVDNGQEALKRLESQDYDLVLMDCLMPVLDGYKATQMLRTREGLSHHTTVIAMTANAMKGEREKCLDVGMDDYISKPIECENLETVLNRWLADTSPKDCPSVTTTSTPEVSDGCPIDFERLQQLSAGDPEFEADLLQSFLEDAPAYFEDTQKALAEKDMTALAYSAHKIKGVSSIVGVRFVPEIAAQLQEEAEKNNLEAATILVSQMDRILQQVYDFVKERS